VSVHPPVGQERAVAALRQVAFGGARTLLFAGPAGVGRRQAARWLAALLNCEARLDDPCGRCPACQRWRDVEPGLVSLADYREIAAPTTTKDGKPTRRRIVAIDQLVERPDGDPDPLRPWLLAAPNGRVRVAVIDGADDLGDAAANAFLKTLEEPPEHARIVLIASGPDAVLPTVASRCTVIRFAPVSVDSDTWQRLGPHPALRLGRPSRLSADPEAAATRDAVDALVASLEGSLGATFAAMSELHDRWVADDETVAGLLREHARARGGATYVVVDAALEAAETASASYAQRALVLKRLALALRAAWRNHDTANR